jgi:hypothetical protein
MKSLKDTTIELIDKLAELQTHPDYHKIKGNYSPDVTVIDSQYGLLELLWEIQYIENLTTITGK